VSWDEYHLLIERLALKIDASGWQFDQILCLARGGMRPGDIISRVFDKPLAIMATSSYRAEAGTIQGRLDMAKYSRCRAASSPAASSSSTTSPIRESPCARSSTACAECLRSPSCARR
jgi:hypothetical protein